MTFKPILIVCGEPNSIFLEIFFKIIKYKKFKTPIILICSHNVLKLQMNHFNFRKKINLIDQFNLKYEKLNNDRINLINVDYNVTEPFENISVKSKKYIANCFLTAIKIINKGYTNKLINGPVSKKHFLNKKFPGVTEYLSHISKSKPTGMLIYNKQLSVCPITTHYPINSIAKKISKKLIIEKIILINNFYIENFDFKPSIGITGLNPHCETTKKYDEDEKIIRPSVKFLKRKKINISGPYPADTIFMKRNRINFDVIVGMYHDQVLTPVKTLFEYDAINITMGLPYIRISPDHGPNEQMIGLNKSNPTSLLKSIEFLDKR